MIIFKFYLWLCHDQLNIVVNRYDDPWFSLFCFCLSFVPVKIFFLMYQTPMAYTVHTVVMTLEKYTCNNY